MSPRLKKSTIVNLFDSLLSQNTSSPSEGTLPRRQTPLGHRMIMVPSCTMGRNISHRTVDQPLCPSHLGQDSDVKKLFTLPLMYPKTVEIVLPDFFSRFFFSFLIYLHIQYLKLTLFTLYTWYVMVTYFLTLTVLFLC